MWPFRRRREKKAHIAQKVVVGLIIGGAIGSIVGKKLMEKHECEEGDDDVGPKDNGFTQKDV